MSAYTPEDWLRLAREVKTADHCHGLVTRDGEQDACGKPPVAIIDCRDFDDGYFWPACAYHANRYGRGRCVSLAVILASLPQAPPL
jgi:hypothetical protein